MHKQVSEKYVNPQTDSYNYWNKKTIIEGLDILLSKKVNTATGSEDEIIDRVWKMIPWAFGQGHIVAKRSVNKSFTFPWALLLTQYIIDNRGKTSKVSRTQMNQRRKFSSSDPIMRVKTGKRVDMAFTFDSFDLGIYEAEDSVKEYSNERIGDQQIEVPKIMKGTLDKLLSVAPTKLRKLETIGLITSGMLH